MYKLNRMTAGSVIAVAAVIGSAGLALADGYSAPRGVVVAPADSWSGVYFGVASGYQTSTITQTFIFDEATDPKNKYSSSLAGGFLGAQHKFGSIVLGVEA